MISYVSPSTAGIYVALAKYAAPQQCNKPVIVEHYTGFNKQ